MKKNIFFTVLIILVLCLGIYLKNVYTVPVLMYHSINEGAEKSRLIVSPEDFERQMNFLKKGNYDVLTLDEYADLLKQRKKPKRKSVVITFDDGYRDNFTYAFPVLQKYKFPATIFIVMDWVGKEEMMDWEQIEQLSKSDLIEIGSHGLTHCELTKVDQGRIVNEIKEAKQLLETRLDKKIKFFCYPCGLFSPLIKEVTRRSGYKAACATDPGKQTSLYDEYAIGRIRISRTASNLFIFWSQISGYYTYFKDRRVKN